MTDQEYISKCIAAFHPRHWPGLAISLCLVALLAFSLIPLLHGVMTLTGTEYVLSSQYRKHPLLEIISHVVAVAFVILAIWFKFAPEAMKKNRVFGVSMMVIVGGASLVGLAVKYL